jgi:hypothetical protein
MRSIGLVLLLALTAPAPAATNYWNTSSGAWDVSANWSLQSLPAATDDVVILAPNTGAVSEILVTNGQAVGRLFIGTDVLPPQTNFNFWAGGGNPHNQDPYSWGYTFPWSAESGPSATGDLNCLIISGPAASLSVTGFALIGYRCGGDSNRFVVESGATASVAWLKQATAGFDVAVAQSNLHNQTIVRGGTLNLTNPGPDPQAPYGEFAYTSLGSGDFIMDSGTVHSAHYIAAWGSTSIELIGIYLRGGLLDTRGFGAGYQSGAVRIGDGKGQSMELHVNGGDGMFYGSGSAHRTQRDPDDPGQGYYTPGICLVVKSDGILSGSISNLWSEHPYTNVGFLIEGGAVAPGDATTAGTIRVTCGWLGFDTNSTLDIDIFSEHEYDRIVGSTQTNYSDYYATNGILGIMDVSYKNSFYIANGARLVVRLRNGYQPKWGQTWTVMRWRPGTRNAGAGLSPAFLTNWIHHGAGLGDFTLVSEINTPDSRLAAHYDDVAGELNLTYYAPRALLTIW